MSQYAQLTLLQGKCNSMDLPEIEFRYPLRSEHEQDLHKEALKAITFEPFQLSFYWSLVPKESYKALLEKLRNIRGAAPEPIYVPMGILHEQILFEVIFQFEGYSAIEKDRLVHLIEETGIHPTLDPWFSDRMREREISLNQSTSKEELTAEEERTFARNLSFYIE